MKAQTVGDTSSLDFMRSRRVFEVNPEHPIIKNLDVRKSISKFILSSLPIHVLTLCKYPQAAYKSNPNDEDALRAIDLLYDAALVSSGFTVNFLCSRYGHCTIG